MEILLMILYPLAGCLLAIPYCLLAGWSPENFPMVAIVAPAFLFIWFVLASFAGVIAVAHPSRIYFNWWAAFSKSNHRRPGALSAFWAWTLYSLLPVILHWSAVLLEKVGYETVSSLLNTHRYASSSYIFMLFAILIIVVGMWDAAKSMWT